jgi:hypothetical protein
MIRAVPAYSATTGEFIRDFASAPATATEDSYCFVLFTVALQLEWRLRSKDFDMIEIKYRTVYVSLVTHSKRYLASCSFQS